MNIIYIYTIIKKLIMNKNTSFYLEAEKICYEQYPQANLCMRLDADPSDFKQCRILLKELQTCVTSVRDKLMKDKAYYRS